MYGNLAEQAFIKRVKIILIFLNYLFATKELCQNLENMLIFL